MKVNKVEFAGRTLMDISDSTVRPEDLMKDETAYNAAGERIVGTLTPMTKEEYGGSAPGVVAQADKAREAVTAQTANTLGGKTLVQVVPNYSLAETRMPENWINGKPIYRRCLELALNQFSASTSTYYFPDYAGNLKPGTVTSLTTTGVYLTGAVEILPQSCAMSLSKNGENFRPLSNARPGSPGYAIGLRFDKSGTGWKIAIDLGSFKTTDFEKFALVVYYTK